jgi:hypothetical protein
MTVDNRLSLQHPGGRIADEKLGVAAAVKVPSSTSASATLILA